MNNLIAESIKDLEFILTEWEGDTNALLGAVRVSARLDRITPILIAIAEKTREETERDTKMWWIQSIVDNLGYVLLEGHGGGNWRRLVIILQEDFEKMLANLSDKEKK